MIDAHLFAAIAETLGGRPPDDAGPPSVVDDATLLDSILPGAEVSAILIIALVVYILFLRVRMNTISATVIAASACKTSKDRRSGGIDALGRLSWNIDRMIRVHATSLNSISSHAFGVGEAANKLRLVSEQMGRFADDTSEEAMTVSSASSEVSQNIQAVAASAEEMDVGMREIARSASEAARVAMEAVDVAENTNQTVSTLVKNSAEIESVIKVISGITEQTNLLALNAAIEAARAGEAGKGFAVVATEVKELAFETARAAEEVAGKVGAIQQSSRGAVDAIENICEIIHKISEIQAAIASSVEEQTSASMEIGRSVTQAAASGAEITQNIAGVAEKSSATMKSAVEIRQAADEVGLMAQEIEKLLQPFRGATGELK